MEKIMKFPLRGLRKITGGQDPVRIVEEFIEGLDKKPADHRDADLDDADNKRWELVVNDDVKLEILLEQLSVKDEATIYLGMDLGEVPLRAAPYILPIALELADSLVGVKVGLVGNFLVLSAAWPVIGLSVDEIVYHYNLLLVQQDWFLENLQQALPDPIPKKPA